MLKEFSRGLTGEAITGLDLRSQRGAAKLPRSHPRRFSETLILTSTLIWSWFSLSKNINFLLWEMRVSK